MTTGQYAFSHAEFSVNNGNNITIQATNIPSGFSDSTVAIRAPVPEPESYAMLLAGLGLMGFMVRRKKTA